MELERSLPDFEQDPRQEALEEAAFVVWQMTMAFQKPPHLTGIDPVRPPEAEEWRRSHEAVTDHGIAPEEVEKLAQDYFDQTLEVLFPIDGLEFFQHKHALAIRAIRHQKSRHLIQQATRKRLFLES